MGAEKPQIEKPSAKSKTPLPIAFIWGFLLLIGLLSLPVTDQQPQSPAPDLHPKDQAKLEKRLKEIDDSEQYALIATVDGWYPCLHSGHTTFYLLTGEVWKYGVTSKGEFGRYAASFLLKNRVTYLVQFKGNFAECLKQEQIQLFNYPYLPESLARPMAERLPRPPYNPITR